MGLFQHVGTACLIAATGLLIGSTITTPVISEFALIKVNFKAANSSTIEKTVALGTFGYCTYAPSGSSIQSTFAQQCSGISVGYNVSAVLEAAASDDTDYTSLGSKSLQGLTYALVAHPVAAGLALLAAIISMASERFGFIVASSVAGIAWLVTVVVLVVDCALWGIIRSHVIKQSSSGFKLSTYDWKNSNVRFDTGMQLAALAVIALTAGMILGIFSCCCGTAKTFNKLKDAEKTPYTYHGVGAPYSHPNTHGAAHAPYVPKY